LRATKSVRIVSRGSKQYREKGLNEIEKQGLIQSFEYTFELAWNLMRDYLIYQGISEIRGSRDAIRLAFRYGLIENGRNSMNMLSARNLTSHTYNEKVIQYLLEQIAEIYYEELEMSLNKFLELEFGIVQKRRNMTSKSKTKREIFGLSDKTLEKLKSVFSKYAEIEKAILYGSRAKGNFSPGSDIDICIVAPEMSFSKYLEVLSDVDELDIPEKVDLTKYELLDESIKEHIRRVGKEIYRCEED